MGFSVKCYLANSLVFTVYGENSVFKSVWRVFRENEIP